jgi:hypothetical protein
MFADFREPDFSSSLSLYKGACWITDAGAKPGQERVSLASEGVGFGKPTRQPEALGGTVT